MNYRDIDLAEGQRAVFNITVTAPAGTDTTLTGGVTVRADDGSETDYRMTAEGTQLTAGALPVGRWVYEIRAGGRTVVYGFLVVHPSPLAPDNGESVWQITGDLGTAEVQIELADGLRGDVTPEAEQARIDAQAAATAAQTAGSAAETARISALNAAAAATSAADRAVQQATAATGAATAAAGAADDAAAAQTAAETAKTAAETARDAAQTARDVAVQAAAVYDTHVATMATYDAPGHVKLGETSTAASAYAAHVTADENGRLAVRRATTSVVGCIKLGTGVQVTDDAGMVGATASGAIAVRKASANTTTGVGCVRLAASLEDTGDVAVPTAAMVNTALQQIQEQFAALLARVEALETAAASAE